MAPPIIGLDGAGFDPAVVSELYKASLQRLEDERKPLFKQTSPGELYKTLASTGRLEERLNLTQNVNSAKLYELPTQTLHNNQPTPTPSYNQPSFYQAA